ncbi:unnamed protein product [Parnassius mnemosyne]|uniref:Uncharacterized protein n=1 Tax=Parnassius mnemosyne TaxID=213953 RepID=A0AAV1KC73_9NEOP
MTTPNQTEKNDDDFGVPKSQEDIEKGLESVELSQFSEHVIEYVAGYVSSSWGNVEKKLSGEEEVFEETTEEEEIDTSTEEDPDKEQRKYKPYFVSDYNRREALRTLSSLILLFLSNQIMKEGQSARGT